MGQCIKHLHLDHFGIDHDETQLFWGKTKDHAGYEGIDANTLAAPGCAGHQQVRHLCQVGNYCFPINIFAKGERKLRACFCLLPVL